MHDHDLDLIAALVEGRLEDETEARALIASSAEAREEYELQKLAYESLREVGSASLTESERVALHRDVWTELRTQTPAKRVTPWYYRWVPVAAGLFVVIGLVTVLSGGDQEVTGTFADIASGLGGGGDGGAMTTSADGGDAARDDAAVAESESTDTTEAMSEATTTAAASAPQEQEDAAFFAEEAARVRLGEFSADLQDYDEASDRNVETCLEQAELVGNHLPVATLTRPDPESGDLEESIVIAAPEDVGLAEATLAFIDLDTCEIVYLDEPPG
jgi:hypothetical protein